MPGSFAPGFPLRFTGASVATLCLMTRIWDQAPAERIARNLALPSPAPCRRREPRCIGQRGALYPQGLGQQPGLSLALAVERSQGISGQAMLAAQEGCSYDMPPKGACEIFLRFRRSASWTAGGARIFCRSAWCVRSCLGRGRIVDRGQLLQLTSIIVQVRQS